MKILIMALAVAFTAAIATAPAAVAQDGEQRTKTSLTGAADTTTFLNVKGDIKGFAVTAIRDSGTLGGKVYLQGAITPSGWVLLDSLTLSNIATPQTKVTTMTNTHYRHYRYVYVPSGTSNTRLQYGYIRRPDE